MLPIAKDTSFADISMTFEWWVLFGVFIIMNSKSAKDSALKCVVFFLDGSGMMGVQPAPAAYVTAPVTHQTAQPIITHQPVQPIL